MTTHLVSNTTRSSRIWAAVALSVVMVLIASACETTQADNETAMSLVNSERAKVGRNALAGNIDLHAEADRWAQELRNSCSRTLRHRSPLTQGVPAGWTAVGENVAYAGSLSGAHNALMGSDGHRNNILSSSYTHVGIGVVHGNCWGWNNTWVVQIFMRYTG